MVEQYYYLKNDRRTNAELKKLKDLLKGIPEDKVQLTQKLIENAAFMSVLLMELQADIKTNGYRETYQNGVNQHGYKKRWQTSHRPKQSKRIGREY